MVPALPEQNSTVLASPLLDVAADPNEAVLSPVGRTFDTFTGRPGHKLEVHADNPGDGQFENGQFRRVRLKEPLELALVVLGPGRHSILVGKVVAFVPLTLPR
jgi:hypothetical protein